MYLMRNFPYIVAGYILAVGMFFCISALVEGGFLNPEPPGRHFLTILSILFIGVGIYSILILRRGKLEEFGKSINEVRQESIVKLKDTSLLARIALEDESPEIRNAAEKRLEELNN